MSSEDNADSVPLTQLLGRPVRSPQGESLGKISDLIARIGADAYPLITGFVSRTGNRAYFVPWAQVQSLTAEGICLSSARVDLRPFARREGEMLLARDLLDRKVIDVAHRRVMRANDVLVRCADSVCRLIGVDVGTHAVARRLGLAGILALLRRRLPTVPLDWTQVEFFASEVPVRLAVSHAKTADMHPVEIAGVVDSVTLKQGQEILGSLDDETAADAMEEMSPERQADLMNALDEERAADILEKMNPDDAADLLADLPAERAGDILQRMEPEESEDVRELLQYPEHSAGGIMTNDMVVAPRRFTVAQVLDYLREQGEAVPEMVHYLYVVDAWEDERLVGIVPLRELLIAQPQTPLEALMLDHFISVPVTENDREVAHTMARYNLLALPVVDEEGRLLGIITVDDVMELVLPGEWKKRLPNVFR